MIEKKFAAIEQDPHDVAVSTGLVLVAGGIFLHAFDLGIGRPAGQHSQVKHFDDLFGSSRLAFMAWVTTAEVSLICRAFIRRRAWGMPWV